MRASVRRTNGARRESGCRRARARCDRIDCDAKIGGKAYSSRRRSSAFSRSARASRLVSSRLVSSRLASLLRGGPPSTARQRLAVSRVVAPAAAAPSFAARNASLASVIFWCSIVFARATWEDVPVTSTVRTVAFGDASCSFTCRGAARKRYCSTKVLYVFWHGVSARRNRKETARRREKTNPERARRTTTPSLATCSSRAPSARPSSR